MRVAAAYEGEFVDWRGIAFDGSHGTHTSIKGEAILTTDQPAWQNPKTKDLGRPKNHRTGRKKIRPFAPLVGSVPGAFQHGDQTVVHYRVGDREIHELPGRIEYGKASDMTRTTESRARERRIAHALSPETAKASFHTKGSQWATLEPKNGFACLRIKASDQPQVFVLGLSLADGDTCLTCCLNRPTLSR